MLVLVANVNKELKQLDVETASSFFNFFNGDSEEKSYIKQPKVFN
jgi:hypothetical protein